jgi:hypothetical protein
MVANMKFKIKTKQLKEITNSQLGDIKRVLEGNQMPDLFGNVQRFAVDTEKPTSMRAVISDIYQTLPEYQVTLEMMDEFLKYLNKKAAHDSSIKSFRLDIPNGYLVRRETRTIPSGPKKGEIITRDRNFALSSFMDIFSTALEFINTRNEAGYFAKDDDWYNDLQSDLKKASAKLKPAADKFWNIFEEIRNPDISKWKYADDFPTETEDEQTNSTNIFVLYMSDLIEYLKDTATGYQNRMRSRDFNNPPLELFQGALQGASERSKGRKIIFSRAPIDIARMSDFSQSGIQSCHSPGTGGYFDCALFDANKNGAVAYLVPTDVYEKTADKLQERDYFKDLDRSIEGPVPISRIRIRRFYYIPGEFEIGIPEIKMYGSIKDESFIEQVKNICIERQRNAYDNILDATQDYNTSSFIFVGGSWSDDSPQELMDKFFSKRIPRTKTSIGKDVVAKASEKALGGSTSSMMDGLLDMVRLPDSAEGSIYAQSHVVPFSVGTDADEYVLTTYVAAIDPAVFTDPDLYEKFFALPPNLRTNVDKILKSYQQVNPQMNNVSVKNADQYFIYLQVRTVLRFPNPHTYTREILQKVIKHFNLAVQLGEFEGRSEFSKYFEAEAKKFIDAQTQPSTQLEMLNRRKQIAKIHNFYRR